MREDVSHLNRSIVKGRAGVTRDIERAARKFYARFKVERAAFLACIEGIDAQAERERYTSLLLNRLMFMYFLQKQGFFDYHGIGTLHGDRDYLVRHLQMMPQEQHGAEVPLTFYRFFLVRFFHEGLASSQRSPALEKLLGNVPYLNTNLFDVSSFAQKYHAIDIPDRAFTRLFAFFDEFEWCLDGRPLRNERALNQEVIGEIFEKYLSQKQAGAYYTQRDIAEYINKNSIIPCLFERVADLCPGLFGLDGPVWGLLRGEPDRYIYAEVKHGCVLPLPSEIEAGVSECTQRECWEELAPAAYALPGETWREVVARRQRCEQLVALLARGELCSIDDLITSNLNLRVFAQDVMRSSQRADLLAAFYAGLTGLTILDPTCGSGAFLLTALAVLEPLYAVCLERMQFLLEECVQQGIWKGEEDDTSSFQTLREILHKSAQHANREAFIHQVIITKNLYGVDIMYEATEICKLRLLLKLASHVQTGAGLAMLPDLTFNIRPGNALVGFATEREIARLARLVTRDLEEQPFTRDELDGYLATDYGIVPYSLPLTAEQEEQIARWKTVCQPFHWIVEYRAIVQNGGFDVIIGNPPYISYNLIKNTYQVRAYETQNCGNLCAYVLERALALLRPRGRCGVIMPISTIASESYRSLRHLLLARQVWLSSYANRPGKLFANAEQRLAIVLLHNLVSQNVFTTAYQHWYEAERPHLFATLYYTAASIWPPTGMPLKSGSALAEAIFARMIQCQGFPLLHRSSAVAGPAVWIHNGPTYWVRALPFEPNIGQKSARSNHYRKLPVRSQDTAFALAAILSSSTFYFFYKLISNCRDLGQKELRLFPLGELAPTFLAQLVHLGQLLAQRLRSTAEQKTRHYRNREQATYEVTYEEYYPARARDLLNEIDRVLAAHYHFSAEELDFLLHYDLKYRLTPSSAEAVF